MGVIGSIYLAPAPDYTPADGSAKFLNLALDSIYCEMTHPGYPDFTGADARRAHGPGGGGEPDGPPGGVG